VANVRHLSTGHISPQFHVIFDDFFETVICNGDNGVVVKKICNDYYIEITNSMLNMNMMLLMFCDEPMK
jgi:hypothetical protein